jgi:rhodanese-related sulfurtransferase
MGLGKLILWLGVSALVAGCGNQGQELTDRLESIAQAAVKQQDRVTPEQLADWIISRKRNFQLLDIRSNDAFEKAHIQDAENIPLVNLLLPENLKKLPQERKLVVYSNGSEQAAKASVMLRMAGFDAYLLLGGYNHWQRRILNPDIPDEAADDETPEQALQRAISCYFSTSGEKPVMQVRPAQPKPPAKGYIPPLLPQGGGGAKPPVDEGC